MEDINIRVRQEGTYEGAAYIVVFVVCVALMFWQWLLVGALIAASITCVVIAFKRRASDELSDENLRRRADEQIDLFAAGDPRGIYGPEWSTDYEGLQPTLPAQWWPSGQPGAPE